MSMPLVSIAIGSLDDPKQVEPRIHQWFGDRLPWYVVDDRLPRVTDGRLPHPSLR